MKSKSVKVGNLVFGGSKQLVIAGPCAVESREQVLKISEKVAKAGADAIRAQLWKPRTKPDSFQGVGEKGVKWLLELKEKLGVPVASEVLDKEHIRILEKAADILWVGARNMQNFELLKALSKQDKPVILKRGLIATLDEWLASANYINFGNKENRVILCERGVRTGVEATRFTLDLGTALVAKVDHGYPVIVDPSHAAGRMDIVPNLAKAAIAAGLDGIVVEVHNVPEKALSDKDQQITTEVFERLMKETGKYVSLWEISRRERNVQMCRCENMKGEDT